MPEIIATGRDIDAYCTRCKLELAHTILAMVGTKPARVKCNTCHTDRNYRAPKATAASKAEGTRTRPAAGTAKATAKPGAKPGAKTATKSARAPVVETAWELEQRWVDVLGQARRSSASELPFALTTTYTNGQVVQHSKFGDGVVVSTADAGRMTVRFKDGEKVMAHGRPA